MTQEKITVKEVRGQLAPALGVILATRWGSDKTVPSKPAQRQFASFCEAKGIDSGVERGKA